MPVPADTNHSRKGSVPQPVWVYPLASLFAWAVALVLLLRFFDAARMVLLGLLAAGAAASMLQPLARLLPAKRGVSGVVVGLGFLLAVVGLLSAAGYVLVDPIRQQLEKWPELQQSLDEVLAGLSERLDIEPAVDTDTIGRAVARFFTGERIGALAATTAEVATGVLIGAAFIFIGSIYILVERPGRLVTPVLKMLPPSRVQAVKGIVADLPHRLRWWLLGTLTSMVAVGIASGAGYMIIGLQFALPLALFAFVAEAVPTVGPAATLLVSLLVAAAQGTFQIVGVVAVYVIVQTLESYVLIPLVMRRAVHIPPIVTLFTIVLWGKVFGVVGVLLAIPIDLAIWTFVDNLVLHPSDTRPP